MIKPEAHKVFMQIFRDFEESWQEILGPSEETGLRKTIIESRRPYQGTHTVRYYF